MSCVRPARNRGAGGGPTREKRKCPTPVPPLNAKFSRCAARNKDVQGCPWAETQAGNEGVQGVPCAGNEGVPPLKRVPCLDVKYVFCVFQNGAKTLYSGCIPGIIIYYAISRSSTSSDSTSASVSSLSEKRLEPRELLAHARMPAGPPTATRESGLG